MLGRQSQPLPAAVLIPIDVEDRRQDRQKRVALPVFKEHPTANKFRCGALAWKAEPSFSTVGMRFDQFKKIHDAMKRDAPGAFLSQEWFVDDVGADLLERGRRNEAIAVFQLNTELYPQSANTNAIEALKKLAPP